MKKLNLSIGSIVFYQNEKAEIIKLVDMSSVMINIFSISEKKIVPINELRSTAIVEEEVKDSHIVEFDTQQWNEAQRRLTIITPLLIQSRTKEDVEKVAQEQNVHYSTLYRWIKAYEKAGVLTVLVPKYNQRGGKGGVRIQEESELIMNKVIQTLYLNKQKLTPKQVYFEIKKRCVNADVTVPHENTVRNRIKKLSDKSVFKMRESRRNAERLFRNTDGMFPSGKYPLDVVQIDHTPVDLIIVDEQLREPIGRPFLTLAIDVYSRMITGFYISLKEPSYFSVSQCMSQSILSKEKVLRDHEVDGEWNIWGIPRTIHLDNGQDFRSIELQRTCEQFGISIEWRPVARPQFGAHIERLIGTSMQEVHTLPGTTFSNIQQRGEYDSSAEAIMTLAEFERWFCEYVVNVYNKRLHSMIGMTPEKKYEIGIFGDEGSLGKGLPEKVEDEEYVRLSFLPSEERTIQQTGVSIDKIHYYHDVLRRWIKAKDERGNSRKFIFKIDPRDISQVWFFDPEIKEYFALPYRNVTYPRISRWELRRVKQYLAEKNIEGYDEDVIFTAYDNMKKIRDEAASKTKSARKEKEAKRTHERKKKNDFSAFSSQKVNNESEGSMDDLFKDVQAFDDIDIGDKDES
jgi:putative transposase